ncbi:ABC transporter family substrate-binding protein [Brachybacterium sp. EF45031]|uniref:ABC transporter family substrate-binding protein n=1 Tax=Brachybacterium sillae TaxID=2810536 RepID=UPI00217EE81E|nr:ABC transporter family substrate-binding protein [Brachybacterium sillae]MCS6711385.1 ABC transporter family substrate-binding protein [Brachybacterium sillae]
MFSTRRTFLAGTGAAGSAALLAACGGQQTAEEQASQAAADNEKAAEQQSELPNTAWERLEYDQVPDGGTITVSILQYPVNWNQSQIDGNNADTAAVTNPMGYDQALRGDETGKVTPNPDYIESAELISEDPQKVKVVFNMKAVWGDGKPIVVADLISQWKACNGTNKEFNVVSTEGWSSIKNIVQTDDEYTCEIEYAKKYADWIIYTYPTLPAATTATPQAFNTGHAEQPVPASGPFKIGSLDKNGGVITLVRNEKWWGRAPKLEQIVFRVVDQTTQPQSFANGEIDVVEIATGDVLSLAKGRQDATIQRTNGLTWTHLTINTQGADGALGDVKVREAIARGIDRDAIGRAVVGPLEAPIVLQNNFIFMPGQEGWEDSFGGLEYDPEAAKKILDDAGWALNGDVREKDGKQLAFSVIVPADTKSNSDRARQVMTNLNAIGFKVDMQEVPSDAYFNEYISPKQFDVVTFSWVGTLFPIQSGPNKFMPESEQNYTNLKDEKLVEINGRLQQEFDQAKRIEIANEFSKQVASSFNVIPFYATPIIVGVKKGIVNYGASQFESVDWTAVGIKA